jgi:hypothetical protein
MDTPISSTLDVMKQEVPPVQPSYVLRYWCLLHLEPDTETSVGEGVGRSYSIEAIAKICGCPLGDALPVWARTTLLIIAFSTGSLTVRKDADLPQVFFDLAASVPLPHGLEGFNCDEFVERLKG